MKYLNNGDFAVSQTEINLLLDMASAWRYQMKNDLNTNSWSAVIGKCRVSLDIEEYQRFLAICNLADKIELLAK